MRVWALNLDAEMELAHPGGGAYTPPRRAVEQLARAAARFARSLPPGDLVVDQDLSVDHEASTDAPPVSVPRGAEGVAWCPTPRAVARLRAVGARVGPVPTPETLRRVNGRAFAFALASLPGARLCVDATEAEAALARPGAWLAKRELSFAGRGRRRVRGGDLDAGERAWLLASLREGPVLVTPWVEITLELARHGMLTRDGRRQDGEITVQEVDPHGQHRRTRLARAEELRAAERSQLQEAYVAAAAALVREGYFGPFGIDAFRYRTGGAEALHPLSDLNARYSMGWPVGMATAGARARA